MTATTLSESDPTSLRFVQLCLRGRWDPDALDAARRFAAQNDLDWTSIQALDEGRLRPLLYAAVRGRNLAPAAVEQDLREARLVSALRERLQRDALEPILERLAGERVQTLLLKGAALIQTVYPSAGLRPMDDLDVLVPPEDAKLALGILSQLGYHPLAAEERQGADLAFENEVRLGKPGPAGVVVELHWGLLDSPLHQRLALDWFWQSSLPVRMGATQSRVFGPEAQLLHQCGHLVLHHSTTESGLLWYHDVAEVLNHYRDRIDWDVLLEQGQACGLVLPLQLVLQRVASEWGGAIPAQALERLCAIRPSAAEEKTVTQRTARRRPVLQRFWSDLGGMQGWGNRWRYFWLQMFPSAAYMQRRYRIHNAWLTPLYYPYRWFSGLREALAG